MLDEIAISARHPVAKLPHGSRDGAGSTRVPSPLPQSFQDLLNGSVMNGAEALSMLFGVDRAASHIRAPSEPRREDDTSTAPDDTDDRRSPDAVFDIDAGAPDASSRSASADTLDELEEPVAVSDDRPDSPQPRSDHANAADGSLKDTADTAPANGHGKPAATAVSAANGGAHAAQNATPHAQGAAQSSGSSVIDQAVATTAIQQQVEDLARTMGYGTDIRLKITLTKDAGSLMPHPPFTLTAPGALMSTVASPSGRSGKGNASRSAGTGASSQVAKSSFQPATTPIPQAPAQSRIAPGFSTEASIGAQAGSTSKTVANPKGLGVQAAPSTVLTAGMTSGEPMPVSNDTGVLPTTKTSSTGLANSATKSTPLSRSITEQVSVNITKALKSGTDRIEIRLKPESLGRLEVRLDLVGDGRVVAAITADRPETLDLLKADAQGLERALQDAGLRADSGNLSFNLRGQDPDANARGGDHSRFATPDADLTDAQAHDDPPSSRPYAPQDGLVADGRIDIHA